jgi:hypothetical protein
VGDRAGLVVRAAPQGLYFFFESLIEPSGSSDQRGSQQGPGERRPDENDDNGDKAASGHDILPADAIRSAQTGGCRIGVAESSADHEQPMSIV